DAVARQQLLYDVEARAEQGLRSDHMVAGTKRRKDRCRHRRHAGRGRARGFRALEFDHAALEHRNRGIGIARIDEAGVLALETRLALLRAVVDIALGEEQRFRGLAELRAQGAAVDEAGFGTITLCRTSLRHVTSDVTILENGHKKPAWKNFHRPGS